MSQAQNFLDMLGIAVRRRFFAGAVPLGEAPRLIALQQHFAVRMIPGFQHRKTSAT